VYHGGIETNNYMETMNRVVKLKWLNNRVDQRLDPLIRDCVNKIEPYYHKVYMARNYAAAR
jgi:hypothetical protein